MDDLEKELDVSAVFRQEASGLSSAKDLTTVLERFGYAPDDRIERRELVLMYKAVEKEMEKEIAHLAHSGAYDEAKEMRQRLTKIRSDFDGLQTNGVRASQRDQQVTMEKAIKELKATVNQSHKEEVDSLVAKLADIEAEQQKHHEIQWENLELEISRMARPKMKYSRRAIELFKAEAGLIRLKQYDDARKVRLMLDKLIPGEEERFYREFEASIEAKRAALREAQANDRLRLEEKLKGIQWKDHRRRELEDAMYVS
jgi:hypothetical protein